MTALATVAARAPRGRVLIVSAVGPTVALWASAFVAIRYADRELPLALLFGWVFLGEVPPLLVLPGGALCLAGVALARTTARAR
jgi:drug/metabolite transporter (DMT)-like permease